MANIRSRALGAVSGARCSEADVIFVAEAGTLVTPATSGDGAGLAAASGATVGTSALGATAETLLFRGDNAV